MRNWALCLIFACGAANADPTEIQRALIQRDRQSAEFSRPELRDLHSQQERRVEIRPDERVLQAREREGVPATRPESATLKYYRALPLPGGPRHGVDPIPVQGVGG